MQVNLKCGGCGGHHFDYPFNLRDNSIITCADCGQAIGTVADVQRKVVAALEQQRAPAPSGSA